MEKPKSLRFFINRIIQANSVTYF